MNFLHPRILQKANEELIYNIYVYLADKSNPAPGESLRSIVLGLESALKNKSTQSWKERDIRRLRILQNAVSFNQTLADSLIGNLTRSKNGLTGCTFTKPGGNVSVVFRGTGSGEWIDNGEGLSGIPEENTYIVYGKNGQEMYHRTLDKDYATDQQVEALNWFSAAAAKSGWSQHTQITVSGHSKGGNKAQFVAINSDLVNECYSFDGQGFSPEAISSLRNRYGAEYEKRQHRILSFAADNDYVNVLGTRLAGENHIYYFKSHSGFHYPEALLDKNGKLNPQCEQGTLSKYVETVSKELMSLPPFIRQYATLGIMNIFQKYLGEGLAVNGDSVSPEKTVAGIAIAISSLLNNLPKGK